MFKILAVVFVLLILGYLYKRLLSGKATAAENNQKGEHFLAENKAKEGVIEMPSGLQYQVLKKGEGDTSPAIGGRVKVHYHGTLMNGNVFDSSVQRGEPIEFGVTEVIAGWTEVLLLMVKGDHVRVFIPSHLGYGDRWVGGIPAGSLLIFDIELIDITG